MVESEEVAFPPWVDYNAWKVQLVLADHWEV